MSELLANRHIWTALAATLAAQVIKILVGLAAERRFHLQRLVETGGMPSSHTSTVTALATGIAITEGVGSIAFAIVAVFGSIVIYDATGIRRAAGIQAALVNDLVHQLQHVFDEGFQPQVLKTLLGHTYPQVVAGAILGIAVGLISFL